MNPIPNRSLPALAIVHAAASLAHFVHNATFLDHYPNMPGRISPAVVYGVWLAEAAVGAAGVILLLRGRTIGLAPIAAHTLAMNATIWLETATGIILLLFVVRRIARAPGSARR